jgi:hypothetical protein
MCFPIVPIVSIVVKKAIGNPTGELKSDQIAKQL